MARKRFNMTIRVGKILETLVGSDTQTADVVDAQADIVLADSSIDAAIVDIGTADGDIDNARADVTTGIAALVTMDSDLDTLIAAAQSANSANDATTEIDAIRDAGTGYVVNIAIVDALFDSLDADLVLAIADLATADTDCDDAIADLVNAAASLTQGTANSPDADVSISFDTTNVTTVSQLRAAFAVAEKMAVSQGLAQ